MSTQAKSAWGSLLQRLLSAPSPAPVLGSAAGGTLGATTYYVKITYVGPTYNNGANGESLASSESNLAVGANNVLTVNSPAAVKGATGYNVYVSNTAGGSGAETKQNSAAIAIGTNWQEPTTGLIAGGALPATATAYGAIEEVLSISGPAQKAKAIDVTNMDSPAAFAEKIVGILDGGQVQVEHNWTAATNQQGVLSDLQNRTVQSWVIAQPGTQPGAGYWKFQAIVVDHAPDYKVQDRMMVKFTLEITGEPTFATV